MHKQNWEAEIFSTVLIFAISGFIGVVIGYPLQLLLLVAFSFIVWNLYHLAQLEKWLDSGKIKNAPSANGYWGIIYDRYYQLLRSNKKRKKKLRDILKRFRTSTQAIPYATVVLTGQFKIQWINTAAQQILGLDGKTDIGKSITQLIRTPKFIAYCNKPDKAFIETPSPLSPDITLNIKLVQLGGGDWLLMARDITERKQMESMRRDFISNASHELKTPLTVIQGYIESFQERQQQLPENFIQPLAHMQQQSHKMAMLLEDMLQLARIEEQQRHEKTHLNPANIIETVIKDAIQLSGDKHHQFNTEIKANVQIIGVEQHFHALVSNLVFNAVRYTPAKSQIAVQWIKTHSGMLFLVSDTGNGIPHEHIKRLTERFYRVDESRSTEGTGLGLSIVKHILESYQSVLKISSIINQGSQFSFIIPEQYVVNSSPLA